MTLAEKSQFGLLQHFVADPARNLLTKHIVICHFKSARSAVLVAGCASDLLTRWRCSPRLALPALTTRILGKKR